MRLAGRAVRGRWALEGGRGQNEAGGGALAAGGARARERTRWRKGASARRAVQGHDRAEGAGSEGAEGARAGQKGVKFETLIFFFTAGA